MIFTLLTLFIAGMAHKFQQQRMECNL